MPMKEDKINFLVPPMDRGKLSIYKCSIQKNGRLSFSKSLISLLGINENKFIKIGTVETSPGTFRIIFKIINEQEVPCFPIYKTEFSNLARSIGYYVYLSTTLYNLRIDFIRYRYNFVVELCKDYIGYHEMILIGKFPRKGHKEAKLLDKELE